MEASSHALDQHRITAVDINSAIFTNLTHEHLDYHGTLQHYAAAKEKLFSEFALENAIINLDDPFGNTLIEKYQQQYSIYTYTINDIAPIKSSPSKHFC